MALLGTCVAAAAGLWLQRALEARAAVEFGRAAARVAEVVESRIRQPVYGLKGAAGLYVASREVHRREFRAYVGSRDLPQEFPGVRGFGFIERVERNAVPTFVAKVQADEVPQFAVRELTARGHDDLYVIKYIEPAGPNAAALGLDVGSEPIRRNAAERAVATGLPTLTAVVTLVQDEHRSAGFLLFLPVFRHGADPTTPVQRRQALVGLLYAPMVVGEILGAVPEVAAGLVHFQLSDAAVGNTFFDSSEGRGTGAAGAAGAATAARVGLSQDERRLSLFGREAVLRVHSTPQFDALHENASPWIVFVVGALASALLGAALAVLLRQQASLRTRAEALAEGLTAELERLAQVVRHTSNAVLITDRQTRITWVNEGFTRITGYHLTEALGRTPGELLSSGKADPAVLQTLADAVISGTGCRVEILNRAKSGHEYWNDTEVQPLLDAKGDCIAFMEIGSDITASKQAEAALLASQALLDKTGRIAGVGGWAVELDTQAIVWSDQTCRIHDCEPGHQPGLEEAINYYAPEARAVVAQLVQRCIDSGEGFDFEQPLHTAQGRAIWVRSVGELETADGRPLRLVGTFQDVTVRHQLEAEVRRKSELINSVIENLPCGLSVFDADLQLVASNTEFRRLLDFPETLFAGPTTRFEDVIRFNAARGEYGPGDVEATVQAIVERAHSQSVQPHQFERVRPDGTPLEIRGGPMPGGGFVTTYTDISARQRAEAEVQRVSALLRGSIDALDDAYALFDTDDRMVLCNQRYRDLYPLIGELMQPGARFEDIVRAGAERGQYADAVGRVEAFVAERLAAHRQPSSTVTRRLGDGRILRIGERRMADGHIVGFHVDITEFVRATEAAQEASRSKSQFLANMSHEIRTPMNAILGMLALLKKTGLTTRQADYTGKTEGAARSLLGLLNDILDFSKVEAGKMTLDPHPFRPDQLLRDLAVILAANTAGKPIEVLFDIDPQLPPVLVGDAMRLQQVLINLGGNAIKFTAQGEVVVSVAVVGRSGNAVTLEVAVRDSGIGIAPENQQRIFSGFSQAEASTTRRFGGTGLGLAICQRLVGLMGSELRLDSAVGSGSRFHFRIELAVADEQAGIELAPLRLRQPVALRVLVVDDNAIARDLMGRMAESLGWQVTLADGGAAAVACLQGEDAAYDAVFIDWQMPDLDGWGTCALIHQGSQTVAKPLLIMVTAHGREMLSQRSAEEQARVGGFLVKPVTASMLYDAVVDARADPHAPAPSRTASSAAVQRLAGLRLLVVEDNANNQQVARELLEDEGASVQIADNGLLAVEAVAAADPPFDVVLMDLQMPVMDGYTATTRIRQDLQQLTLPIVAMTANAMAADREACLAAGMNDHVGKPFDLDHLVAVLLRQAGRADMTASGLPGGEAALALPGPVLAAALAAGVDIDRALARLGGKVKVYGRTLRSFTAELRGLPLKLDSQLQGGERDLLRRELHTLKGVAATVGVTALARLAGEAEAEIAHAAPTADGADCVGRVSAAIHLAAESLELLCAALDDGQETAPAGAAAAPLTPVDTALLAGLLRTVKGLLQASDLDAADALQTLRARLPAAAGPRLDALETAVESLEFESALSHCGEWLLACEA